MMGMSGEAVWGTETKDRLLSEMQMDDVGIWLAAYKSLKK